MANRIIFIKNCGRQFVADCEFKTIGEEIKELIKRALLERNSPRGICRIFKVSLTWLMGFVASLYGALPADLDIDLPTLGLLGSADVHMPMVKGRNVKFLSPRKATNNGFGLR